MNENLKGAMDMRQNGFDKRELLKYVGDTSQLFGIKDYTLNGGRADGVRAVDIRNGSGLEVTVLPDRALDMASLSYKGINLSYITSNGIVGSKYFKDMKYGFPRNFFAGLLTTCGLTYMGAACNDNGEELGSHGRISNTPAEEVYAGTEYTGDVPVMKVRGRMRETRFFGENVVLEREISVRYGENKIYIKDKAENYGFRSEPFMILYHFNFGYPLLSKEAILVAPSLSVVPRDPEAEKGKDTYEIFQPPTPEYREQVFYHDLAADGNGRTFAALVNTVLKLGAVVRFNKAQLSRFTQWKQMGEGAYVTGLEPCNCHVEGRDKARRGGTLEFIDPGETRSFDIEIEVIEGDEQIHQLQIERDRMINI